MFSVNTLSGCPSKCKCERTSGLISVNCEEKNITKFPLDIDESTQLL